MNAAVSLSLPSPLAVGSGHWPVPSVLAGCGHGGRYGLSSHSVFLFWVLNIAATLWTWTPCLSAPSQKRCLFSFKLLWLWELWGALKQPPHTAQWQLSHQLLWKARFPQGLYLQISTSQGLEESCWRMACVGVLVEKSSLPARSPPFWKLVQ